MSYSAAKTCSYCGITLTAICEDMREAESDLRILWTAHRSRCAPPPVPQAPPPEHSS